jgi:hypothetical protein
MGHVSNKLSLQAQQRLVDLKKVSMKNPTIELEMIYSRNQNVYI